MSKSLTVTSENRKAEAAERGQNAFEHGPDNGRNDSCAICKCNFWTRKLNSLFVYERRVGKWCNHSPHSFTEGIGNLFFHNSIYGGALNFVGNLCEWGHLPHNVSRQPLQEEHFQLLHPAFISHRIDFSPSCLPPGYLFSRSSNHCWKHSL